MTKLRYIGKQSISLMQAAGKPVAVKTGDIVEVSDRWATKMLDYKQQIVTQTIKKQKDTDFNITTYKTEDFQAWELVEEKKKKDTSEDKSK